MIDRDDAPEPRPWARPASPPPATDRRRQVVEELPDWEPLPPGEILVRRPHRADP
ncbi:hypothetical protein GA0070558_101315 [Micromonospora haikouensis]|uniref:Uncharacterized protein n=1 Tax=Micromonospora haikouensis TaxID=686309 RepID=A0A1C4U026_9ACTN|nr:hypothetical protein [Micromonospora haikouensis]SCE65051.1 hypothetical protein GA0070558_101315 [Micromonospora haikouensis]